MAAASCTVAAGRAYAEYMADAALIGRVNAPDLHVMTFNIRRRLPTLRPGSPDRWNTRKALVRRLLTAEQPSLIGVQEALPDQVEFLSDALGAGYDWVGRGRHPDGHDEHNPIFFDATRLRLTDWRQHALSDTPHQHGSRSWGNLTRRVAVAASFTDTATGASVLAVNTHFDHLSRRSRLRSAGFILTLVRDAYRLDPATTVTVTGDLNTSVNSEVYRRLTAPGRLRDCWAAASDRLTPEWGTFSHYRQPRPGGSRIDFVLVGPGVDVLSTGINAARFDGLAASDHEPVQAVLRSAAAPAGPHSVRPHID